MYTVIKTECYPNEWKVVDKRWPGRDNATCNYFYAHDLAQREANRRNAYKAEGTK